MDQKVHINLIVISILEFKKLKQGVSDKKMGIILGNIKGIIEDTLRREGDAVFSDSGEMMIVLAGCDEKGALSVINKSRKALDKYLFNEKLPQEIKLRFGSAAYPEEAENYEALIKKAKEA